MHDELVHMLVVIAKLLPLEAWRFVLPEQCHRLRLCRIQILIRTRDCLLCLLWQSRTSRSAAVTWQHEPRKVKESKRTGPWIILISTATAKSPQPQRYCACSPTRFFADKSLPYCIGPSVFQLSFSFSVKKIVLLFSSVDWHLFQLTSLVLYLECSSCLYVSPFLLRSSTFADSPHPDNHAGR